MISETTSDIQIRRADDHWMVRFSAMASPCEILLRCESIAETERLAEIAIAETFRIERKFSRYRNDNIVSQINTSAGRSTPIDDETARLLKYAAQCHALSEGQFDITSGVLRKAWNFSGEEFTPDEPLIDSLLELVGWDKTTLTETDFQLRPGMEIDLGGIGKEYAVDRVARLLFEKRQCPLMVNFGGDIRAISPANKSIPWRVGIEDPERDNQSIGMIELVNGAVATSGVAYRFCLVDGRRLGHILDPHTGWPVEDAPRSVTVLADYCMEAGLLSTLGMLHGLEAESFLNDQNVRYFCRR
jgi:thiamine biosynthesis lipoprotein